MLFTWLELLAILSHYNTLVAKYVIAAAREWNNSHT